MALLADAGIVDEILQGFESTGILSSKSVNLTSKYIGRCVEDENVK